MRSSTDIVSISTGRETILIGPLSAFGAQAASTVLRDRFSIIQTLEIFAGRPNAAELLRPHLRRWGVDPVSLRIATRQTLVHALARLASNGSIGIAKVPDVTLSFAGASLDEDFKQVSVKPITELSLPPDLSDRMMLVFEMAPQYMEGETRLAFENAVRDLGMGLIVGAVVAWIGAHFIPGVNIAMLAFDLFFLSATVLHALERAHEIVGDVRDAKSRAELKPAAIAMAAVLSILIVEGVLGRLLRAKILTKGVGKTGGHSDAKPSLSNKEAKKPKEKERLRERDRSDNEPPPQKQPEEPDVARSTNARRTKAKELGVDEKWVNPDGTIKWPPKEGFAGPVTDKTLQPGETFSRYGGNGGTFASPPGTPFEQRGLPPSSANQGERQFRVVKELPVKSGEIAPWFDQPGGGTQYKTEKSIGDLLEDGIIEELF